MGYVLILSNRKKTKEFLKDIDKKEMKRCRFMTSLQDLSMENFPKKADVYSIATLIPPPDITTKYLITGNFDEFEDSYYHYLSTPMCHAMLNKIAKEAAINDRNSIVCFGDIEYDNNIHKFIKKALRALFKDLKIFTYSDWEDDRRKVEKYDASEDSRLVKRVMDDACSVGKLLRDLESCNDPYDESQRYRKKKG